MFSLLFVRLLVYVVYLVLDFVAYCGLLFGCLFCLILYCAFDTCVLLVVGGFGFTLRLAVLLIAY